MTNKKKHVAICPKCKAEIDYVCREMSYEQITNVEPDKKGEMVGVVTHEQICSDNYSCPKCEEMVLIDQCGITAELYALFGLEDHPYNPVREILGKPILDQITAYCEHECHCKTSCAEGECVLWRIERVITEKD